MSGLVIAGARHRHRILAEVAPSWLATPLGKGLAKWQEVTADSRAGGLAAEGGVVVTALPAHAALENPGTATLARALLTA
jgi:hypothetical protein